MYLKHYISFAFVYTLGIVSATELDYDGSLHLSLYHSFDDDILPNYEERGNVTISSIRSGSAAVTQTPLNAHQINKLQNLALNNGKYKLKALVKTSSGSQTELLVSILACNLLGSNLDDILYIWLDNAGEPVAVNIISRGPCSTEGLVTKMWNTEVQVKHPDGGPTPDTATYIQKLEREKQARESGETKDNRSFFAKYWMYIVPAVIFFVLTSATNPDAAGGGGGGGGQQR